MKNRAVHTIIVAMPLALALASPSAAIAGERPGDAALGALSGAVVLGPIGAVAGAVVGYSAGPSIAHSLGFRRSTAARRRTASQQARARNADREYAASNQPAPSAAPPSPAPQETANTAPVAPPVQGLE